MKFYLAALGLLAAWAVEAANPSFSDFAPFWYDTAGNQVNAKNTATTNGAQTFFGNQAFTADVKAASFTDPSRPGYYGVVGDGVTDDTTAFQTALNSVSNLTVPPARYLVGTLTVPSAITINAAGAVLVRKVEGVSGQSTLLLQNVTNVTLRGITIDGQSGSQPLDQNNAPVGIKIIGSSSDIVLDRPRTLTSKSDGIYIGGLGSTVNNVTVLNAYSKGNGRQGMSITSGQNIKVIGGVMASNTLHGLDVEVNASTDICRDVVISELTADGNGGSGIQLAGAIGSTITHGWITVLGYNSKNNANYGLNLYGMREVSISGNSVSNAFSGLAITANAWDVAYSGNLDGNSSHGADLTASGSDTLGITNITINGLMRSNLVDGVHIDNGAGSVRGVYITGAAVGNRYGLNNQGATAVMFEDRGSFGNTTAMSFSTVSFFYHSIFGGDYSGVGSFTTTTDVHFGGTMFAGGYGSSSGVSFGNIYAGDSTTGPVVARNRADANPAMVVSQSSASSTGDILQLKNSGGIVLSVTQPGVLKTTAPTNGIAPPPVVNQPLGLFGSIMKDSTNIISVPDNATYKPITNFTIARTNGFTANLATGFLTNTVAGFYRFMTFVSYVGNNSDTLEIELFFDETGREEVSTFHTFDNPARADSHAANGILYIPANTGISIRFRNRTDADSITVWRAGLSIGTP